MDILIESTVDGKIVKYDIDNPFYVPTVRVTLYKQGFLAKRKAVVLVMDPDEAKTLASELLAVAEAESERAEGEEAK